MVIWDKHSSLICQSINDEENERFDGTLTCSCFLSRIFDNSKLFEKKIEKKISKK